MKRNSNTDEPPTLVPITEVARAVGYEHAPEVVWRKLEKRPADVHQDWRYEHGVTPARARQLVDEFRADAEQAEETTRRRNAEHERRLEREHERLRREAAASRPAATGRVLHGVQSFGPGDGDEPDWATGPSIGGDES
jgi:hypothetical protein